MIRNRTPHAVALVALAVLLAVFGGPLAAAPSATDWVEGHKSRIRLLVGGRPAAGNTIEHYAALEIRLAPGWKTYWRQPGNAGGIPPAVDVSGSTNVAQATLLFPAPHRFTDVDGDTIGYKRTVVFPLRLALADPARPAHLAVSIFFGVCREICIPAEARFSIDMQPAEFNLWPPELAEALDRVPVAPAAAAGAAPLPRILAVNAAKQGDHRELLVDVKFPAGTAGADLFAETGDDMGLAMAKVARKPGPDVVRYSIAVVDAAEWDALGKHGLRLTIVSEAGAVDVRWPRPD